MRKNQDPLEQRRKLVRQISNLPDDDDDDHSPAVIVWLAAVFLVACVVITLAYVWLIYAPK